MGQPMSWNASLSPRARHSATPAGTSTRFAAVPVYQRPSLGRSRSRVPFVLDAERIQHSVPRLDIGRQPQSRLPQAGEQRNDENVPRVKRRKQAWNCAGSSRRNTRPKVSWLGMPWHSRSNWRERLLGLAERCHGGAVPCPARHGAVGDHQDFAQVAPPVVVARVLQPLHGAPLVKSHGSKACRKSRYFRPEVKCGPPGPGMDEEPSPTGAPPP